MKRLVRFFTLAFALWIGGNISAQNITVMNALDQRIDSFLFKNLLGDGVYIYNVKFANDHDTIHIPDIGTFNANGYAGLSMSKGVIMTTGNIAAAVGPNNKISCSQSTNPYYTDTLLNQFLTGSQHTTSCATVDFDFVCASGSIQLDYVFGSEEYPEFVGSSFNDVFAFLVSGPHPLTGEDSTWNIAMVPNSVDSAHPNGVAVSINNVNDSNYAQFYQPMYSATAPNAAGNNTGTQYDGMTGKLAASTSLYPCTPYHMHISICNAGDYSYDSGVFFDKGCLKSPVGAPGLTRILRDTVRKACPISIPLSLANSSMESISPTIHFSGSAVNGTDFICKLGNTVLNDGDQISIGNDTVYFTFQSKVTSNNPKSVVVSFETAMCDDYPGVACHDTMRFVLYGDNNIKVKEKTISAPKVVTYVSAELASGTPPINFQWVPGTDILFPFLQSSPADIWESRDYQVIAYDNQRCYFDTGIVHVVITGNGGSGEGIEEADEDGISVYPNPVDNLLHVSADQIEHLELFSIVGSKVYDGKPAANESDIDMGRLTPGTYALRITTPNGVFVRKVVKR